VLLREALANGKKVGIAKVIIKTRQYLAGVKAMKHALVLELMHFAEELSDAEKLNVPKTLEPGKRELDMANALVESMSSKWDPEKYHDDYREALLEVIEEKVESGGKEIEEKPKEKSRRRRSSILSPCCKRASRSHRARRRSRSEGSACKARGQAAEESCVGRRRPRQSPASHCRWTARAARFQ
jgi:DNA end-binding protein Ku